MTEVIVPSALGPIDARWHSPVSAAVRGAVICVGGFDGGFDGPAEGIYADLADALPEAGIGMLRLDFRVKTSPGPIDDGTADLLAGVGWLAGQGVTRVALIGHSYGGAIVIRAAARSERVVATCALSTQTMGIESEEVRSLAPRSLLLIHGAADWRLPPRLSEWVYSLAGEGRELHILEDATHSLRQRRDDLWTLLIDWLDRVLP
ncbi:MAG: alpha/beta hydrolase [Chloroflexi bacterium]|nr:alpha/beta hydrolase [Chloroflexota bacterium]MCY3697605.1 alpha/beta hydrolase [Chloroflexota bacterium]